VLPRVLLITANAAFFFFVGFFLQIDYSIVTPIFKSAAGLVCLGMALLLHKKSWG
jgi:hypothetical protein